jgi:hypothetical protein
MVRGAISHQRRDDPRPCPLKNQVWAGRICRGAQIPPHDFAPRRLSDSAGGFFWVFGPANARKMPANGKQKGHLAQRRSGAESWALGGWASRPPEGCFASGVVRWQAVPPTRRAYGSERRLHSLNFSASQRLGGRFLWLSGHREWGGVETGDWKLET